MLGLQRRTWAEKSSAQWVETGSELVLPPDKYDLPHSFWRTNEDASLQSVLSTKFRGSFVFDQICLPKSTLWAEVPSIFLLSHGKIKGTSCSQGSQRGEEGFKWNGIFISTSSMLTATPTSPRSVADCISNSDTLNKCTFRFIFVVKTRMQQADYESLLRKGAPNRNMTGTQESDRNHSNLSNLKCGKKVYQIESLGKIEQTGGKSSALGNIWMKHRLKQLGVLLGCLSR